MKDSAKPSFSWKPLIWFFFVALFIGIPVICANVMKADIGDSIPGLTIGVVETLTLFYCFVLVFLFFIFACFTIRGFGRWIGLVAVLAGFFSGFYVFGHYYRIEFSGDMLPQEVVPVVKQGKIEKEAEIGQVSWKENEPGQFPRFLGPNADLKVDWVELDPAASAEDFKVLWKRKVGDGWSGFTAVDGVAFTMEQNGQYELVTARDIETGKVYWIHRDQHRHENFAGGVGPRSTPTFHHGKLYTLGAVGTLNCLDPKTGEAIWTVELPKMFDIPVEIQNEGHETQYDIEKTSVMWGRSASPLIVDEKVIVPVGGSKKKQLVTMAAFNKETGELIWKGGERQISYGTPVLATIDNVQQLLLTTEEHVVGHDLETGEELWSFPRPGQSDGQANTSQPILIGKNTVLMTKEYGLGGQLVKVSKEQKEGEESSKWTTEEVWKNHRALQTKLTVAIIDGDYAYCLSAGIFECTNIADKGKRMWRAGRYKHGQLLKVGEFFLVMSEDGQLFMLEADEEGCEELVKTKKILEGRCWNTLCIYKDKLLARSNSEAVCIQLPVATESQSK